MKKLNTGIFTFDDAEVLDFAVRSSCFRGPVQASNRDAPNLSAPFNVFTVALP